MITHANLCAQVASGFEVLPLDTDCRVASILPLSHLFELTGSLLYPLAAGAAVHYVPSRRGPDLVRVLAEQHITHMLVVPQILSSMGQAAEDQLQQRVPSPRSACAGRAGRSPADRGAALRVLDAASPPRR